MEEIKRELSRLCPQMARLQEMIKRAEEDWTSHYDEGNPDDMFMRAQYAQIAELLGDAGSILQRLNRPIVEQGPLVLKNFGRYEIQGGSREYSCGSSIEFLIDDGWHGKRWVLSRVEAHTGRYYIVGHPELDMEGVIARVRA